MKRLITTLMVAAALLLAPTISSAQIAGPGECVQPIEQLRAQASAAGAQRGSDITDSTEVENALNFFRANVTAGFAEEDYARTDAMELYLNTANMLIVVLRNEKDQCALGIVPFISSEKAAAFIKAVKGSKS